MTRPALAVVGGNAACSASVEIHSDDRLLSFAAPIRRVSAAMIAVAAGSLIVHIALMAAAVLAARAPPVAPPQREIAVEIVPETPKPSAAAKREAAKPPPKPAAPPAAAQTQAAKPAAAEPSVAKPSDVKPPGSEIKALQDELAKLRSEEEALKAAQSQEGAGKALALPSIGAGDGDAVGYQQLVFSQLAKAKGDAEYHGEAGLTGVKFEIDDTGKLVRVEVTRASGKPALDAEALDIVRRAAPFPPPPTADDRIVFANVNFVPPKRP